jgi:hypothetical protein
VVSGESASGANGNYDIMRSEQRSFHILAEARNEGSQKETGRKVSMGAQLLLEYLEESLPVLVALRTKYQSFG